MVEMWTYIDLLLSFLFFSFSFFFYFFLFFFIYNSPHDKLWKKYSINISLKNIYRRFYTNLVSFVLLLYQGFTWLMISMCKGELFLMCWGNLVCSFCHMICSLGECRQRENCLWGFESTKWTMMMSMIMISKSWVENEPSFVE